MIHRFILLVSATLFLVAAAVANVLPPQFDDTIPPTVPDGDTTFPTEVPIGKTLLIPVAASNPNGGALVYSATSSNPSVTVRVRTGNPVLNLVIDHVANSGSNDIAVSGSLQLMLFREFTPNTSGIIGGLAQGGYYDGVIFHRIIPKFMSQGGDPTGTGGGGPGFSFENEFKLPLIFTGKGQLAMANAGYDKNQGTYKASNGSQFFITYAPARKYDNVNGNYFLDFNHTIFGQLVRGWDTFYQMSGVETNGSDKPLSNVTITSASVSHSNDAVLFLSATGTGSAVISVAISDYSTGVPVTTGTQFTVTAAPDLINNPPIILPPSDAVAALGGKTTVIARHQDLEFDEVNWASSLLLSSTAHGIITRLGDGSKLEIKGSPAEFAGLLNVGVGVKQANFATRGSVSDPYDYGVFKVGIGDKALTPLPVNLMLKSGSAAQLITAARFLDKDSSAVAGNFTGVINWGDGTVSSGSNVTILRDPTSGSSARFLVQGNHAYPKPGIYPVRVNVTGNLGATANAIGVANVSSGSMIASGLTLISKGGNISKKQVASFQDETPLPVLTGSTGYQTVIDWGDGVSSSGTVMKLSGSNSFKVIGSHRYQDSASYPINVSISKPGESVDAWSLAEVSKINKPPFLPPLLQAHLTAPTFAASPSFQFSGTTSTSRIFMSGVATVRNIGNKKSLPATLRFVLTTSGGTQTLLPTQITVPSIKAGGQVSVPFTNVLWPEGTAYYHDGTANYVGMSVYFQVVWSDPLADLEPVDRGPTTKYGPFQYSAP